MFYFVQTTISGQTSRPQLSDLKVGVKGINTIHIQCSGTWVGGGLVGVTSDGTRVTIQGGGETSGGSYSWDKDYDVSAYDYITGAASVAGSIRLTFSDPR